MVVVAAGMGGGTGTGASPVIAEIAKKTGALTLGVVTRPFEHEGPVRKANAEDGIKALIPNVDAYVVIPNERINLVCEQDTDLFSAFARVDEVLVQAIQGISEIIHSDGVINRDFADVKRILTGKGKVMMGIGAAVGEERAKKAVQKAINSPFLEGVDISGANTILLLVSSPNMLISEYNEITAFLQKSARPGVELVPGWVRDESLKDGLRVTIIATGFEEVRQEETIETVLGLENFVNPKYRTDKASSTDQPPAENLDSEVLVRLSDGQYEIPAFMRRKLATKPFHN
jgi:cell division protein FtsZ